MHVFVLWCLTRNQGLWVSHLKCQYLHHQLLLEVWTTSWGSPSSVFQPVPDFIPIIDQPILHCRAWPTPKSQSTALAMRVGSFSEKTKEKRKCDFYSFTISENQSTVYTTYKRYRERLLQIGPKTGGRVLNKYDTILLNGIKDKSQPTLNPLILFGFKRHCKYISIFGPLCNQVSYNSTSIVISKR